MIKIELPLIEFYNYVINIDNYDRNYFVSSDKTIYFCYSIISNSKECLNYHFYFKYGNLLELEYGQIRRPIVLDVLLSIVRKEKINKIKEKIKNE